MKNFLSMITFLFEPLNSIPTNIMIHISIDNICMELSEGVWISLRNVVGCRKGIKRNVSQFEIELYSAEQPGGNIELKKELFDSKYENTIISNIQMKCNYTISGREVKVPVSLNQLLFYFEDGSTLDYTPKVTVGVLSDLSGAA